MKIYRRGCSTEKVGAMDSWYDRNNRNRQRLCILGTSNEFLDKKCDECVKTYINKYSRCQIVFEVSPSPIFFCISFFLENPTVNKTVISVQVFFSLTMYDVTHSGGWMMTLPSITFKTTVQTARPYSFVAKHL